MLSWAAGERLAVGEILLNPKCYQRMRTGHGRHMYTPPDYAEYKRTLRFHLKQILGEDWQPIADNVVLYLATVFHNRIRRDEDNARKAFCDAANGLLWVDDHQVKGPLNGGIFVARDLGIEPGIRFAVFRATGVVDIGEGI